MKTLTLMMYSLIFLYFPLLLHAQKLHFIEFSTTTDSQIGTGNEASLEHLGKLLEEIKEKSNLQHVEEYSYLDSKFTKQNFFTLIDSLNKNDLVSDNDVVWFYFLGHGEQSSENEDSMGDVYPSLIFQQDNAGCRPDSVIYRLSDIYDKLKGLNARLTLCMSEACNSPRNGESMVLDSPHINSPFNETLYKSACSIDLTPQKFNDLFLHSKGSAIVTSSEMGQKSYVHVEEGGIFTNFFCHLIRTAEPEKNNLMSWGKLLKEVKNETQSFTEDIGLEVQIPAYCELITYAENENYVSNENKRFFFANLFEEFSNTAKIDVESRPDFDKDFSTETLQKLHINCPFSYYILKATVADYLSKDGKNAFIYYSVASRIIDNYAFSKPDQDFTTQLFLLRRLHRIDSYFNPNKTTETWLEEMCVKHQQTTSLDFEINNIMKKIAEARG